MVSSPAAARMSPFTVPATTTLPASPLRSQPTVAPCRISTVPPATTTVVEHGEIGVTCRLLRRARVVDLWGGRWPRHEQVSLRLPGVRLIPWLAR
jgi:hypothetical protein